MFPTDTGDQSDELLAQEMERQEREALQQRQDDLFEKMSQVRFIALFFKNLCPIPAQGQDKGHKVILTSANYHIVLAARCMFMLYFYEIYHC